MAGNLAFGRRIRELREAKKRTDPAFSLRRFAQTVGFSATFLSKVEIGEFDPPSADNIKRMAELLGADPWELLHLAEKADPEVVQMYKDQPREMADFLRTAREKNLAADDWADLTRRLRGMKRKQDG